MFFFQTALLKSRQYIAPGIRFFAENNSFRTKVEFEKEIEEKVFKLITSLEISQFNQSKF